jgi:hypothetical protein
MRFPRTLLATATLAIFFALSGPFYAQQPDQERDRLKAKETTVTGCLVKADNPDQYVLTDSQTGSKMTVTGVPELETHAKNHTVRLTGTPTEDGKGFRATKVQHVSDSCQPSK